MALQDLLQAVDALSTEDLETLYVHISEQRQYRQPDDRHNAPLDMDELDEILADLRDGFDGKDLDELEWAMNVEYLEPLEDDQ
jgi:hypothetical protein